MIGALIPGGDNPASFEAIPFAAGASTLSPEAREQLAPLAKFLESRPTLAAALRGQFAAEDRPWLAETMLVEMAVAGSDFPELSDAGFFAQRRIASPLADRAKGKLTPLEAEDQALLERYIEAQNVPEARALAFAQLRAEVIRDALIAADAPTEAVVLEQPSAAEAAGVSVAFQVRKRLTVVAPESD
jgi:hypothetical protein